VPDVTLLLNMSEFQTTAMPSAFAAVGGKGTIGNGSLLTASGGSVAPSSGTLSGAQRPSVIQLVFREKGALYAAYIPAFTDGGLFVPTTREYTLGDDIYLLLSLPEDPQRYPVAGKIAWITPANASGGRTQGVGVRFPADDKTRLLRVKIEQILGTNLSSSKPTQTL
jgi:type IV pilus assembly protein PilZ